MKLFLCFLYASVGPGLIFKSPCFRFVPWWLPAALSLLIDAQMCQFHHLCIWNLSSCPRHQRIQTSVYCVCVCVLFLYTLLEIQPTLFLCYLQHGFFSFFCMKMFKKRLFFALNRRQSASNQTIIAVPVRPLKKRTLAEKSWKMRLMQLEIILQCPKHTAEWRLLWVIWYSSNY